MTRAEFPPVQIEKVRRVFVVGTSGSGKTTAPKSIAQKVGLTHVELDSLFHGPNWTRPEPEDFKARVRQALSGGSWAVCGNYSLVRPLLVAEAELIVWLDLPFAVSFWRVTRRTFRRWYRREVLWNENRESMVTQLFTKDSLFLWVIQTHWRRRKDYSASLPKEKTVRLRSTKEVKAFLDGLARPARPRQS